MIARWAARRELAVNIGESRLPNNAQTSGERTLNSAPRRLRPLLALLVVACMLMPTGCVYYNGIYNAKEAARDGDALLRPEAVADAGRPFQLSAERAESVLVRYPKSAWRTRALYLAGRGQAYSAQCDRAIPTLNEFLSQAGSAVGDRDRARVALASCELRGSRLASARARLDSLVDAPDADVARQARIWAARAALAAGDRDAVPQYLRTLDASALQWELIGSSLSAAEYARAESLLTIQAARGAYRDDATRVLRNLWLAGRVDAVEGIVRRYDQSRVRDDHRATMHYALGELNIRAGRDSIARRHLQTATTFAGRDTVVAHEAAARLSLLPLSVLRSTREVDSVISRQEPSTRATTYSRRVQDQLLLVTLLEGRSDPTGASLYLAAEVARDSLRAPKVAEAMFLRIAREQSTSSLTPRALHAASLLDPDSAQRWLGQVTSAYAASSVAAYLRGDDPATASDFVTTPELLKLRWTEGQRAWTDSLRKLRVPARGGANATSVKR